MRKTATLRWKSQTMGGQQLDNEENNQIKGKQSDYQRETARLHESSQIEENQSD